MCVLLSSEGGWNWRQKAWFSFSEKDVEASEGGFSPSAVEKQKHHG